MKKKQHLFTVCLSFLILAVSLLTPYIEASTVYHETKTVEVVSKGILHHTIKRFTSSGWQTIHVIEANLADPDLQIETLTDERGNSYLNNVLALAKQNNADAAINGDFFGWASDSGQGYPIGAVIQGGDLMSSADLEGNKATMIVDGENHVFFEAFKTEITLIAPNQNTRKVKHLNKHDSLDGIVVYTRDWRTETLGSYNNITEVIVADNIVQEIRKNLPPTEIPENGYMIASLDDFDLFTTENLTVGEPVSLSISVTPNFSFIKTAVGGGSLLVKDGQVAPVTHNISGTNPRTAIGVNQDGTKLYLVTVDGRQSTSLGMTMNEMSALLIELGCYQGMNLDGGGSTTMVSKSAYDDELKVVNSPSDNGLRSVTNAIGVKSTASKTGVLGEMKLTPSEPYVFVNSSVSFSVEATDTNFHPMTLSEDEITFSASGVEGYFENNRFYPTSFGDVKITATCGDISETISYRVLNKPVYLTANPQKVSTGVGKGFQISITGKDQNGYQASIPSSAIKWDSELVSTNGNQLIPQKKGSFVLNGEFLGVSVSLHLDVDQAAIISDGFESANGSFWSYPDHVGGNYAISQAQAKSGQSAGHLTYDFTADTEDKKATYLLFGSHSQTLPDEAEKIGLWVKPEAKNPYWLSAELVDKNGDVARVYLKKGFESTDWQFVEAKIDTLQKPLKLTKIYMLQYDTTQKGTGGIFLDDLVFMRSDGSTVSADTSFKTKAFPDSYQKENAVGTKIAFFGKTPQKNTLLNLIIERKIKSTASLSSHMAFVSNPLLDKAAEPSVPLYHQNAFSVSEAENTKIIKLDASGGGLRKTDANEWNRLLEELSSTWHQNVIIQLNLPLERFDDQAEASLIKQILDEKLIQNGKTVFLIEPGSAQETDVSNGLRTLTVPGVTTANVDEAVRAIDGLNYLEFTVSDNTIQYTWKKLFL